MTRLILLLTACAGYAAAQQPAEIAYDASNPLRLPEGMNLGEAAGVAVNSHGHIFVYNRGARTQLFEFDGDGRFLREIGKDLYGFSFAHTVRIDREDNIWCVDEGSNMVIELNPEGHVLMVIGRKPEPVEGPPRAGAEIPPARGRVYVGDRENNRIQVFDADGAFLKEWTNVGAPWAICITPGANQVLYSSDSRPGRIYKLDLEGNILGVFGKAGKRPGQFGWVHEMACPSENVVYVGELLNWRVQKLVLRPGK